LSAKRVGYVCRGGRGQRKGRGTEKKREKKGSEGGGGSFIRRKNFKSIPWKKGFVPKKKNTTNNQRFWGRNNRPGKNEFIPYPGTTNDGGLKKSRSKGPGRCLTEKRRKEPQSAAGEHIGAEVASAEKKKGQKKKNTGKGETTQYERTAQLTQLIGG